MLWSAEIHWQIVKAAVELTFLLLASFSNGLGLGFAGGFLLGHDDESGRDARQSTRRLDR